MNFEFYNKGTKALVAGKYEKAVSFFKKETACTKEVFLNMGNAYRKLGNYSKAKECYLKANSSSIDGFNGERGAYAPALSNLGLLAYATGDDMTAIRYYSAALEINPNTTDAIWNCSTALLRQYCSGGPLNPDAWSMYDYRFVAIKKIDSTHKLWDGKYTDRLLILAEQGYGDKIQFGRYLDKAAALVGELVIQAPLSMQPLFKYKCVETVEGDYTASYPIAKLAPMFHSGVESGVYIERRPGVKLGHSFNVLVEWAGSSEHANNANRSCYSSYFSALSKIPGVKLFNARPGAPLVKGVTNIPCADWGDTAAVMSAVDLVISVDTSIVHLAGSMGVDCWMLQPVLETDFRWGEAKSKQVYGMHPEANIWYSSVSVLENNGWDDLFKKVEKRLIDAKNSKKQVG